MEPVKVLIVEDNPVDALCLKDALEESGSTDFISCHVETLAEAKDHLAKGNFHVVVLDLGLPDSQGMETFFHLRSSSPHIPIVVLSGLDDGQLALEAVGEGAQDYLVKDRWDGELILRSLRYAIQRHQLLLMWKEASEASLRANRALRVLGACNQLLARATEEHRYLVDLCRVLVDRGGYRMAWIGLARNDKAKTVEPIAIAGSEDGYLRAVKITWSDGETGQGPTGKAIRTGMVQINRSSVKNPEYKLWRTQAIKRGYASSIALPLHDGNRIMGALTLYANEPDAFDDGEVELLDQLASDLSYGISTLRMRAAKEKSDIALQESEQRFRAIFEGAQDCIFVEDRSSGFTHVNPAVEDLFGMPASRIVGKRHADLFGQEGTSISKELDSRVLEGESVEEEHSRFVNGILMTFLEKRTPLRDASGNIIGIVTISRDISERKGMESSLSESALTQYTSRAMKSTLKFAHFAAQNNSTILLLGESGSGKDFLARYIHDRSPRLRGPYFSINCAAIAPELAESELFGHEKGAFTGAHGRKRGLLELAEGGTLLLNEIGELSAFMQAKLLTFLDTKKFTRVGGEKEISVNARLISATNRDLEQEVQAGRFRKDLFYRINVLSIRVPPLRERLEDLPVLTQEILTQLLKTMVSTPSPSISPAMMQQLQQYDWPGNVRELRNVLERAMIVSPDGRLNFEFPVAQRTRQDDFVQTRWSPGLSLPEATDELAKSLCLKALESCTGNKRSAARLLGISRDTLYRYMKKFRIESED